MERRNARLLFRGGLLLGALAVSKTAAAQACHSGPPLESLGLGLHASLSFEYATFDNAHGSGNYAGVMLGAAYRQGWLRARAQLPGYRLQKDGNVSYGPGDALVGAEVAIFRIDQTFAAGPGVAVTIPTGDSASDLGMGHFMVMPGVWAELTLDRTFIQAQLAYGRALASQDAHAAHEHTGHEGHAGHEAHGAGPGPVVNPMNFSEVTGRLSAGYRIIDGLRLRAGVDAALPVADDQGESRAIAVAGIDVLPDPFNVAIEAQVPFVGDPFTAKISISAGVRF